MVWLGLTVLVLLAIDLTLRCMTVSDIAAIIEKIPPLKVTPDSPDERAFPIEIPAVDGLALQGNLYLPEQAPHGLIVFCPEFGGNRWMALRYCNVLLNAGHAVLAFDFRNQGDSDSRPGYQPLHWVTENEVQDVESVLQFVSRDQELGSLPVGIVGISRGGSAGLVAAARNPAVRAILADSAYSMRGMVDLYVRQWGEIYMPRWLIQLSPDWYLRSVVRTARRFSQWRRNCRYVSVERFLPRLAGRSVLLISGRRDSYVKPEVARGMADAVGPDCQVWVVPNAKHNQACEIAPQEYSNRLVSFFGERLGHTTRETGNSPVRIDREYREIRCD